MEHLISIVVALALAADCDRVRQDLADDAFLDRIANPVVETAEAVEETLARFEGWKECLDQGPGSQRVREALRHLELFLLFAPDASEAAERVDLSRSRDPAIVRLREQVGLRPPDGFVYIRYFRDRDSMPPAIRGAFDNPQTQAVTFSSRYVAVLTPTPRSLAHGRLIEDSLQATFSHELVHAFLNARLDRRASRASLPRWFHEGMAIHFSGSGRGHVVQDPGTGTILRIEPVAEYEQYERVFLYLASALGEERFRRTLRETVESADMTPLLAAADEASYAELARTAELWWRWWPLPVQLLQGPRLWLLAAFGLLAATSGALLWRRWQPAIPGSALETALDTDLLEAVQTQDVGQARYLLRSGANANARDGNRLSALMWAVWLNDERMVEALIEGGARATAQMLSVAEARDGSPTLLRMLADALTRDDPNSVPTRFQGPRC